MSSLLIDRSGSCGRLVPSPLGSSMQSSVLGSRGPWLMSPHHPPTPREDPALTAALTAQNSGPSVHTVWCSLGYPEIFFVCLLLRENRSSVAQLRLTCKCVTQCRAERPVAGPTCSPPVILAAGPLACLGVGPLCATWAVGWPKVWGWVHANMFLL